MKREIFIGRVGIGGNHPVSIQSMTSTATAAVKQTLKQIESLASAGCDIVRVALPDPDSVAAFREIAALAPLPVIADIHFDATLAIRALEAGASGLRINPGNIGGRKKLTDILRLAKERQAPIRIGVNAGSLEKKYKMLASSGSRPEAMVRSALDHVHFCEDEDFQLLKISLKSHDVRETVAAYRLIDQQCDYPLHLGITEAGTFFSSSVKSSIGIGALLLDGIGQTIRVSITGDPVQEVKVAREILKALQLRQGGIELIACPTCSRTSVDLAAKVRDFEEKTQSLLFEKRIRVAIMGCEVNGPGEASEADIGLAFSQQRGFIFQAGEKIESVSPEKSVDRLIELIKKSYSN